MTHANQHVRYPPVEALSNFIDPNHLTVALLGLLVGVVLLLVLAATSR
jgi:hypothetical protein